QCCISSQQVSTALVPTCSSTDHVNLKRTQNLQRKSQCGVQVVAVAVAILVAVALLVGWDMQREVGTHVGIVALRDLLTGMLTITHVRTPLVKTVHHSDATRGIHWHSALQGAKSAKIIQDMSKLLKKIQLLLI
ncbi:unnamed protein product, partial [Allacma fusca]